MPTASIGGDLPECLDSVDSAVYGIVVGSSTVSLLLAIFWPICFMSIVTSEVGVKVALTLPDGVSVIIYDVPW